MNKNLFTPSKSIKAINFIGQTSTMKDNNSARPSSKEIWKNAINTLLIALENILLDENGMPLKLSSTEVEEYAEQKLKRIGSNSMIIENFDISYGSLSPLKRKREEDNQRKIKTQKISHSLSSQFARSLSFTEDESNDEGESLNAQHSSLNFINVPRQTDLSQRNFKCYSRRNFGGKCITKQSVITNDCTCDMEIISDHSISDLSGGEDKLVHETARMQILRRILSHSSNENNYWNVSINWIELQAQKKHIPLMEFQTQFQEKSRDMESSLNILHNSIPNNYDDIRVLIDRFLFNADWIRCDYSKPFIQIFPQWQTLGRNVENIVQYVEIIEDMKATLNSEFPKSEKIGSDLKRIQEVLMFKKSLYGEILQQSGLAWKAFGFPIEEAWIYEVKQWLYGLAFHCSEMMKNELDKYDQSFAADDTKIGEFMDNVKTCLKIASQTVQLIGSPNNELTLSNIFLTTLYIDWGLSQIEKIENKARSVEVRLMHICDNINHILHHLRIIQDVDGQDFYLMHDDQGLSLNIIENFAGSLVETGLRLCEHITKPKIKSVTGPANFLYMYSEFVVNFVNRVIEYAGMDQLVEKRMRPLLTSLRNMEVTLPAV
ncbi:19267_t:CDS:2 [Funneliformis geosporum]|uniref:7851_t:CDS:1 n=1 Tax=Funneliformis geosporum TaxID=1117311 RepID=A0A9W4X7U8_9GLOM|nr:19267_t:CDS:2 [Funneliformis geosporum]CAI2192827.1 7851_t:CDS:2 [Funneliformis geosporum]